MKKIIIALVFMALISPVFAQSNSDVDDIYYFNVSIEKIYPTRDGYIVVYRTQTGVATVGIPNLWFSEAAGRAGMMNLPSGGSWPSMSVFYTNGEFSHLRLYVSRVKSHITWGTIPQGSDVSRYFQEEGTFKLEF